MAADYVKDLYGRSRTIDDMMGDDTQLFRDTMAAKPQRVSPKPRTRPEDRADPGSDAEIFSDLFREQGPEPRHMGPRNQWD